jgi:hypothetical protein
VARAISWKPVNWCHRRGALAPPDPARSRFSSQSANHCVVIIYLFPPHPRSFRIWDIALIQTICGCQKTQTDSNATTLTQPFVMADDYRHPEVLRLFSPDYEHIPPWQAFTKNRGDFLILDSPRFVIGVYVDGACPGNGKPGAKGGYGVYFGPNCSFNVSKPLKETSRQDFSTGGTYGGSRCS